MRNYQSTRRYILEGFKRLRHRGEGNPTTSTVIGGGEHNTHQRELSAHEHSASAELSTDSVEQCPS